MNSTQKSKRCFLFAAIFVIGFFFNVVLNYANYITMLTAVPFSFRVMLNAVIFLLPAIILILIGIWWKKRA